MSVGVVPHVARIFQPLRVFVRIAQHLASLIGKDQADLEAFTGIHHEGSFDFHPAQKVETLLQDVALVLKNL